MLTLESVDSRDGSAMKRSFYVWVDKSCPVTLCSVIDCALFAGFHKGRGIFRDTSGRLLASCNGI